MPAVIVVGAQWGDEGKGKIIDILTDHARHIVRPQGGNNAGHTIVVGQQEYKLHLVPAGVLHPHTQCYIGAGTVVDPEVLLQEIRGLESRGVTVEGRLWVSPAAHVIFPYHRLLDQFLEQRKGERSVGTTGRGIGPCYADKANRLGIRMGELIRPDQLSKALKCVLPLKNEELNKLFGAEKLVFDEVYKTYSDCAERLRSYVVPVEERLYQALEAKEPILFEGAQGTFLDITTGTYPYVTSSHTNAGGVCVGAGIGPRCIDHTLGVVKAYTTRVGNGPLPTEITSAESFLDHHTARELGATTGRKRRIGWFDAVLVKAAVRLNGLDSIAITKLDVLDHLDAIKICVAYRIDGKLYQYLPDVADDLLRIEPVYETVPGWKSPTGSATSYDALPKRAKDYLERISTLCSIPVSMVSVGPERLQTIVLHNPLAVKQNSHEHIASFLSG